MFGEFPYLVTVVLGVFPTDASNDQAIVSTYITYKSVSR